MRDQKDYLDEKDGYVDLNNYLDQDQNDEELESESYDDYDNYNEDEELSLIHI